LQNCNLSDDDKKLYVEFLSDCNKVGLGDSSIKKKFKDIKLENSLIGVDKSNHPIISLCLEHFTKLGQGRNRTTPSDGPYDCLTNTIDYMFGKVSEDGHLLHIQDLAEEKEITAQKKELYDPICQSIYSGHHGFIIGNDKTWDKSKPEYQRSLSEFQTITIQEFLNNSDKMIEKKLSQDKVPQALIPARKGYPRVNYSQVGDSLEEIMVSALQKNQELSQYIGCVGSSLVCGENNIQFADKKQELTMEEVKEIFDLLKQDPRFQNKLLEKTSEDLVKEAFQNNSAKEELSR